MPERVIKVINYWGNPQKTADFNNKLQFWDRMKNKYDWENEDLDVVDGKVEIKLVNAYPHIPVDISGVLPESDLQPDEGSIKANPILTMLYLSAAAQENNGLSPNPRVLQTTLWTSQIHMTMMLMTSVVRWCIQWKLYLQIRMISLRVRKIRQRN